MPPTCNAAVAQAASSVQQRSQLGMRGLARGHSGLALRLLLCERLWCSLATARAGGGAGGHLPHLVLDEVEILQSLFQRAAARFGDNVLCDLQRQLV
jgi:hypothetical protein